MIKNREREAEAYADEIISNGENQTAAEVFLERNLKELGYTFRQAEALVALLVILRDEKTKEEIINRELSDERLATIERLHFGPDKKRSKRI